MKAFATGRFHLAFGVLFCGLAFFASLILLKCQEKPPTAPVSLGASGLPGTWKTSGLEWVYTLTSDTTQTGINPYQPGEGAIRVTGAEAVELRYLRRDPFHVGVAYSPSIVYPDWDLSLSARGHTLTAVKGKNLGVQYVGTLSYAYNEETHALIVNGGQLTDTTTGAAVAVAGTLRTARFDLTANVPVSLVLPHPMLLLEESTLSFGYDSSFSAINVQKGDTVVVTGTWGAHGDSVTIHQSWILDGKPGQYTLRSRFFVTASQLTLAYPGSDCVASSEYDRPECIKHYEFKFGLLPFSLISVIETTSQSLSRIVN